MIGPSAAILNDEVDIYPAIAGVDTDAGYNPTYAQTPTYPAVPCMLEADSMEEEVGEQDRITRYLVYYIMTGERYNLRPRSKIIWVDGTRTTHTLFSQANRGEAERGGAFTIRAVERL